MDPTLEAELLALEIAEDYHQAEQSLSHFIKAAWQVLEPTTEYLHNWHIDAIAEHLEAVYYGEIRRLLITEPPRHMKSIQCSVCFPAWVWVKRPSTRIISASYAASLSIKHSVDRRHLIESPWYQLGWGSRFALARDQNQKSEFMNDKRGHMVATSVGASAIGKGGDILLWDDPINPQMAASEPERDSANAWIDGYMTRLDNKRTGSIIGIMQRLHEADPVGRAIEKGGWTHLNLPAEANQRTVIIFPRSKREVVREEGALLWPEREGPAELAAMSTALGSAQYQSQYQQDPKPIKGGFFKREWWKWYPELPMSRSRRVQFWDCAEKPGVSNDFSVCATWDETPTGYYLVDLWSNRVAFPELEAAAKNLFAQFRPDAVVIEDKSAGVQLVQNLRAHTSLPVIPYNPGSRDKVIRAGAAQPTVEAGNCYLPLSRPFVELFLSRHEKFPNDVHDDEVDTTSMMVEFFRNNSQGPRIRSL